MVNTILHNRFRDLSNPMDPIKTDAKPLLKKLGGIQVIAYDFYGTLFISGVGDIGIDDGSPDAELFLEVLSQSGITIKNKDAGSLGFNFYNTVVEEIIMDLREKGISMPEPDIRDVWARVLKQMESKDLIQCKEDRELYKLVSVEFEARMNPVWPMPGIVETLQYFKANSLAQGIISNSQFYTPIVLEALTDSTLEKLGFQHSLLNWSFEEKMKKPGTEFYRSFLKKLSLFNHSITPEEVLYLGNDMLKDIYPAQLLGMKTALFAGDERSLKWRKEDDRCKNLEPDLIITELTQLKDCVVI